MTFKSRGIPWNKGKQWSDEHKENLRKIALEIKSGRKNKGIKRSEEFRKHLSKIKTGVKNPKTSLENHYKWKGGRKFNGGYIMIKKPDHPYRRKDGYILEHRVIMENHLGRFLTPNEVVHHINGNIVDNRIENLSIFETHSEHMKHHYYDTNFGIDLRRKKKLSLLKSNPS